MSKIRSMKWLYAFLAFLLVFATVPVYGVNAEEPTIVEIDVNPSAGDLPNDNNDVYSIITEESIKANPQIVKLTLPSGKNWVNVSSGTKLEVLKSIMVSDEDQDAWNSYKQSISASASNNVLTLTLPADSNYKISNNQTITMNLTPALIENWLGEVEPVEFTIFAQPEINIGGTILDAPANDLEGKTIELNLLNAYWNSEEFETWSELSSFLNLFKLANNSDWSVIKTLDANNPNQFLSFKDEVDGNSGKYHTLVIKLPAITNTVKAETVKFDAASMNTDLYQIEVGTILNYGNLNFDIAPPASGTITIDPTNLNEETINISGTKVKFALPSGVEWNKTVGSPLGEYELELFLDGFESLNEQEQWNELKKSILDSGSAVTTNAQTLELTIPTTSVYELSENQLLEFKVPYQLLKDAADLPVQQIEIKAEPKVLVTGGSAIPSISQADLMNGGKTIELTLVNTSWTSDIASNSTKRQELLKWFNWDQLDKDENNLENQILTKASVERNTDQKVTIILPALNTFKLDKTELQFTTTDNLTIDNIQNDTNKNILEVQSLNAVTAKVTAPKGLTEFDFANENFDISIELSNDNWNVNNLSDLLIKSGSEVLTYSIKEKSDKTITLTIQSKNLNLKNNANFTITIPANALTFSTQPLDVANAFVIEDVKAELSGTASKGLDPKELEKGGKTLIFTLNNATFTEDVTVIKNELSNMIIASNTLDDAIVKAIKASNDSKTIVAKGNKLTIKLPGVTGVSGTLYFKIPANIIQNAPANYDLDVQDKNGEISSISVGAVATATVTGSTFADSAIKNGGSTISITLTNASWDPTILTNKSKQNSLMKGFTVEDQDKEWDKVLNALKDSGLSGNTFTLSSNQKTLTIKLPAVIDYAIIRNQEVSIKITKSVLLDYDYDIDLNTKVKITVPSVNTTDTFLTALNNLTQYINDNGGINNIRVVVPEKQLEAVQVTSVNVPGKDNLITTVVVNTNSTLQNEKLSVDIISTTKEGTPITVSQAQEEQNGQSTYTFVFSNVAAKSDLKITLVNNEKMEVMTKKLSKGKKTYTDVPKKLLHGNYSLSSLLTDDKLLKDIFKYYSSSELEIGKIN